MAKTLLTVSAVLTTAFKRLHANLTLALCGFIALLAAVALSVCIPVYAEAASLRLLNSQLERQEQQTNRSAFALLFRYIGSQNDPLEWERVQAADDFIRGPGLERLDLPLDGLARHARTAQLRLFLPQSAGAENPFLTNASVGFISGMEPYIRIYDGTAPQPVDASIAPDGSSAPIEVMVARNFADTIGINVGDEFNLVTNSGGRVVSIPITIAGLWQPLNSSDPAWFYAPDALEDVILVPEKTFIGPIAEVLANEVDLILWFARLNGDRLTATQATPLLARVESVRAQAAGIVPGLALEQSPAESLGQYRTEVARLTTTLFVFSVPILSLVLYFAALVANLLVNRQRSEIALLKTRGVRDTQILGIYILEWMLLGALALVVGPTLGLGFATIMGRTESFLQLSPDLPELQLVLTWSSLQFGVAAVILALIASLIPAAVATRRTLVDEQQQAARVSRPPFWQRFYLDFLLLIPPAYGLYQLQRGGGLQLGESGADPFSNPLLVLVPVLLCFSLGLIAIRFIPLIFEVLARLAKRPSWVAPLVALRALARQPGAYRGPLLLLILTLSLAAFSASMARTMDGALDTAIAYQVGAQMQLLETGQSTEQQQGGQQPGGGQQPQQPERRNIEEEARFLFVPVSDHLEVEGINEATRVGTYSANIQLGGVNQAAQLVGIDRVDFPKVINRFDRAWADGRSLGELMNMMALNPEGVIVSRNALERGLSVGDVLPAVVTIAGDRREVQFQIIAAVDLWPGYYPQDGPIMVANLDYIFDQMSGRYPYDVWIARDANAEVSDLVAGVRQRGITVIDAIDTETTIREEQARPQRQGLFGLLSVGFIASGLLTLLGFLLGSLISSRRRAIELGVLRALGLSGRQMGVALVAEQVILVLAGIGAGTGIGLAAAQLVIPYLQVGVGPHPGVPAYPPEIAWSQVQIIYIIFGIALLLTLLALAWILGRMRLFQAVKLGDTN
ncbi:MAG: FtsX-like permease family protein [Chloroflexi bacterium AL-W]|nr:FtsX-like permease family protein [Chloroflexi bacterium AL-N1]NOK64696.1 FtsX-like permease family protein [Chloroflexi bacterium AL-N10]NOK75937.1 FtsX-like permease family protein [Chloroflexi bacterium AL-N5]NOK80304.1 FtsX-like permease family protein [Chloroflexi bacterium AL-W]NOK86817.1 FtsX-like permease family protein [Chloroflexi bacterium AL-N15]